MSHWACLLFHQIKKPHKLYTNTKDRAVTQHSKKKDSDCERLFPWNTQNVFTLRPTYIFWWSIYFMLHIEFSYLAHIMFRLRSQSCSQVFYHDLLNKFLCVAFWFLIWWQSRHPRVVSTPWIQEFCTVDHWQTSQRLWWDFRQRVAFNSVFEPWPFNS